MKKFIIVASMLASTLSFAQTKMGPEAIEMFSLLTHPTIVECLQREDMKMMNIEIQKTTYRCPGCNAYKITGNKRNIDTPSVEKTIVSIKGKRVTGFGGQPAQTYTCSVEN